MNFDRINPLSNYLSNNGVEVSDWGIEESTSTLSPSLSNQNQFSYNASPHLPQPPKLTQLKQYYHPNNKINNNNYGLASPTSTNGHHMSKQELLDHDIAYHNSKYNVNYIKPNTENFHKYIKKYLSLGKVTHEFIERFKYNLITSDLLDDSMILSKNDLSLNTLIYNDITKHKTIPKYSRPFNDDGLELLVTKRNYQLRFPEKFSNSALFLKTISLIIFLLKQDLKNIRSRLSAASKLKMFKILLIISTKLVYYKRVSLKVQCNKLLNQMNEFLISNYKINKQLISELIKLKELKLFKFMNPCDQNIEKNLTFTKDLKDNLDHALSFLIFNVKSSIVKLLPFLNGDTFEKYCHINNIETNSLLEFDEVQELDENAGFNSSENGDQRLINRISIKMNTFNQLRKLLISQLLTFNESFHKNFFLCKIWDHFDIDEFEVLEANKNITFFEKLMILESFFGDHISVVNNFNSIFVNFNKLSNMKSKQYKYSQFNGSFSNKNIIDIGKNSSYNFEPKSTSSSTDFPSSINETNINSLINKLSNLTSNLKYFKKYNQSIRDLNNIDEYNEKLMIFSQFNDEISLVKELYHINLNDLQNEVYNNCNDSLSSQTSTSISSRKNSTNLEDKFNLKSFHTVSSSKNSTNSNAVKKRYSLPTRTTSNGNLTPSTSPLIPQTPDSVNTSKVINSKLNLSDPSSAASSIKNNNHILQNQNHTQKQIPSQQQPNDKKYKRLSTGLQLGLLTVLEEPNKSTLGHSRNSSTTSSISATANKLGKPPSNITGNNHRKVSYDDNYINILPPTNYETYNQATLDSLNKRMNSKNNRFSLNSMNSNISGLSDLLASTQVTSFDEDDGTINGGHHLSKEELKLKLEESFNRIYNLEHENENLKLRSNSTQDDPDVNNLITHEHMDDDANEFTESFESTVKNESKHNQSFLDQLEKSLNNRVE